MKNYLLNREESASFVQKFKPIYINGNQKALAVKLGNGHIRIEDYQNKDQLLQQMESQMVDSQEYQEKIEKGWRKLLRRTTMMVSGSGLLILISIVLGLVTSSLIPFFPIWMIGMSSAIFSIMANWIGKEYLDTLTEDLKKNEFYMENKNVFKKYKQTDNLHVVNIPEKAVNTIQESEEININTIDTISLEQLKAIKNQLSTKPSEQSKPYVKKM